jgi:hypothetical protein
MSYTAEQLLEMAANYDSLATKSLLVTAAKKQKNSYLNSLINRFAQMTAPLVEDKLQEALSALEGESAKDSEIATLLKHLERKLQEEVK